MTGYEEAKGKMRDTLGGPRALTHNVLNNSTSRGPINRAPSRAQGKQCLLLLGIARAHRSQRTTPDQAKAILNSQPQIAYALVALMVKIGIIDIPIFQVPFMSFP